LPCVLTASLNTYRPSNPPPSSSLLARNGSLSRTSTKQSLVTRLMFTLRKCSWAMSPRSLNPRKAPHCAMKTKESSLSSSPRNEPYRSRITRKFASPDLQSSLTLAVTICFLTLLLFHASTIAVKVRDRHLMTRYLSKSGVCRESGALASARWVSWSRHPLPS